MTLFLLKKRLNQILEGCVQIFVRFFAICWRFFFAKRTFLFVTNRGIKSFSLGSAPQIVLLLGLIWCVNLFFKSVNHDKIIREKSEEIERLKTYNSYYNEQFEAVNNKLEKVNKYLSVLSGGVKNVNKIDQEDFQRHPLINVDEKNSKEENQTMRYIEDSGRNIAEISQAANYRIERIEKALLKTGIQLKKSTASKRFPLDNTKTTEERSLAFNQKNMGGPYVGNSEIDKFLAAKRLVSKSSKTSSLELGFEKNIDYLIKLENLINVLPLEKPMKSYFLSSGFGIRKDPITGGRHAHYGLDFVGGKNERIVSPSAGKVTLANWFSDYGNAVVIDHGNGLTTRYGHLSQIKVKEGQRVKKGEIIATQGSSGRSTGPHLHYEVRYKNRPLNPKNFIEAGDALFKTSQTKYANS